MTHALLESPPALTAPPNTARPDLWYTRCPVPTISGVALHYRWPQQAFDRLGVNLASVRAAADARVRASHFRHTLPGMFREGGNIPAIWARSRGQDTALIALTWVEEAQLILVRESSALQTPADLKGARIALPRYAGGQVDFERAQALHGFYNTLAHHGLSLDDVELVDVDNDAVDLDESGAAGHPARNEIQELVLGRVDAIYLKGAVAAAQRQAHGLRVLFDLRAPGDPALQINNGTPRTLTVSRQLLREKPEWAARYLAVLLRAAEWAGENPDATRQAIALETSSTVKYVQQAYGPSLHESLRPSLDEHLVQRLRWQKDFLLAHGFIATDFSVDDWMDASIFPRALEIAHTLAPLST